MRTEEAIKTVEKFVKEHKGITDELEKSCYFEEVPTEAIEIVLKENEELKELMAHKNTYTHQLEEDLFQNCSNYVVPKQKIREKIEELKSRSGTDIRNYIDQEEIMLLQGLLEETNMINERE